jgi:uncharacterized protein
MHSPCVARCGLNEDDFCMGCYRHIDEIVSWSSASDAEQHAIWQKLPERKMAFDGETNCQTISRAKWLAAEEKLG